MESWSIGKINIRIFFTLHYSNTPVLQIAIPLEKKKEIFNNRE